MVVLQFKNNNPEFLHMKNINKRLKQEEQYEYRF